MFLTVVYIREKDFGVPGPAIFITHGAVLDTGNEILRKMRGKRGSHAIIQNSSQRVQQLRIGPTIGSRQ